MYDFLNLFRKEIPYPIRIALLKNSKDPISINNLTFGYDGTNLEFPKFKAKHRNLILTYSNAGSSLSNSIHSYYLGFNNTDFTLSNFKDSIEMISDETSTNWGNASVHKFEAGCNIIETNANLIIDALFGYGTHYFEHIKRKHYYGARCELVNFYLKAYNKFIQTKEIHNPIEFQMRNEYGCKRVDKEFPQIKLAKDLYDIEIANEIRLKFLTRLQKVLPSVMLDYSNLSLKEITILRRYCDPQSAEIIKKISFETYRKEIVIYRRLIETMDKHTMKNYIQKIADKTEELIYS